MSPSVAPVLGLVLLAALGVVIWILARMRRELRGRPEEGRGFLMLQGQIEALREQVRASLQSGSEQLDRRLEETNRVVGEVRRGLGEVDRQVRSVSDAARDLRGLQELLRAPKVRGGIGEFLLADLLAQVLPAAHFDLQHAFSGGERVDAVIRLGPRLVPVDAKFPLENFQKLSRAEQDDQRRAARRAFRSDVRRHVDAIAKKYIRPGEGTYDFALMYIPAEPVYHEAILRDEESGDDLFRFAIGRKVVPVSPQSFYAYLQVILLGLRGMTVESRATEILKRLGMLRTHLKSFTESFEVAGRHLGNAQRQMGEAGRRLDRLDAALEGMTGEAPEETEVNPKADG